MVDLTSNRAWAKGVAPTISHEGGGGQRPAFARASQNVVAAATLLDMLAAPFNKVERLYN
jgi:hypothetical protein